MAQLECQHGLVVAPRPARCQVGHDRLEAVLRHILVVQDEIVEDRHERDHRRIGGLFVDRGARRIVSVIDFQDAALLRFAGDGGREGTRGDQQRSRHHPSMCQTHCESSLFIRRPPALCAPGTVFLIHNCGHEFAVRSPWPRRLRSIRHAGRAANFSANPSDGKAPWRGLSPLHGHP